MPALIDHLFCKRMSHSPSIMSTPDSETQACQEHLLVLELDFSFLFCTQPTCTTNVFYAFFLSVSASNEAHYVLLEMLLRV
jgi:hypothetical protein